MCHAELSAVTARYLARFYEILEQMIREMTAAVPTDSISHNFIVQMIPHHRAAIAMSENLLQYTTLVPLQKIAAGIISAQTEGIAAMEAALAQCSELKNTAQEQSDYQRRYEQITQTMFAGMKNAAATNQLDADFMREMIPHTGERSKCPKTRSALYFVRNCNPFCRRLSPRRQRACARWSAFCAAAEAVAECGARGSGR